VSVRYFSRRIVIGYRVALATAVARALASPLARAWAKGARTAPASAS
jgi:hypothetical protein